MTEDDADLRMPTDDAIHDDDAGRKMSYWLALVLHDRRKEKGISPAKLAALADVDQSTITRFEQGQSLPPEVDRYVAAYAQLLGIEDSRELWLLALEKWRREGAPPVLSELLAAESDVERLERELRETQFREQARREHQERTQSDKKARSNHNRRAAG